MSDFGRSLEIGLLQVFRDYHVFEPGGRLSMQSVALKWRDTGFRSADLKVAIDRLVAQDCVVLTRTPEGMDACDLTSRGARRLTASPVGMRDWVAEIRGLILLDALRRRGKAPRRSQRRRSDLGGPGGSAPPIGAPGVRVECK